MQIDILEFREKEGKKLMSGKENEMVNRAPNKVIH